MKNWVFLGPNLISGIGQVTKHYSEAVKGDHYIYGDTLPQEPTMYDVGFVFLLPLISNLMEADKIARICKKMIYMTVCETETVDESYKMLENYQPLYVPAEFCQNVLNTQFPKLNCKILRHYVSIPTPIEPKKNSPYIFYTIGNVADPRKNIQNLIQAFKACNFPDAQLLIKATCNRPVHIAAPNITMINQYLTTEQIQKIHKSCHCYVNCSHSEGVGMGAVEAALNNKPVIITNYGGLQEYVKTPFIINAPKGKIGFDDFLFKRDMVWGHPQFDDIVKCLKECYERRLTHWDHEHTRELITQIPNNLNNIE